MDTQTAIRVLEITSLVISIVGGAFLVYGAIKAPLTWCERIIYSTERKVERIVHKDNLLPLCSPPYPHEKAQRLIAVENERYETKLEELDEKYSNTVLSRLRKVQKLALWGFSLFTIGCFLRAITVCINWRYLGSQ